MKKIQNVFGELLENTKGKKLPDLTSPNSEEINYQSLIKSYLEYCEKEREVIRIRKDSVFDMLSGEFHNSPIKKSFFDLSDSTIREKIKSNESLSSAINELSRVYNLEDMLLKYIVNSTEEFIKKIVMLFFSSEINYLIHLKENNKDSQKKRIEGELLDLNLKNESLSINDQSFDNLLGDMGVIVHTFSILLRINNSEWWKAMSENHSNHELINARLTATINRVRKKSAIKNPIRKNTETKGRPGKFRTEIELHNKIRSLPDWKNLVKNKTQLAKALGYSRSNGLHELLKNKEWGLPE